MTMEPTVRYVERLLGLGSLVDRKSHFLFGPRQTGISPHRPSLCCVTSWRTLHPVHYSMVDPDRTLGRPVTWFGESIGTRIHIVE